jgi:hypothetical protein
MKMFSVQGNYGTLLLAFPFSIEIWFDDYFLTWSPSANLNVPLAANQSYQLSEGVEVEFLEQSRFSRKHCLRVIHRSSVHDP